MEARNLSSRDCTVALGGIAAMAMALGTASGLDAESAGPIPAIVAGLIAAGVMFVPAVPISPSAAAPPARSAKHDGAWAPPRRDRPARPGGRLRSAAPAPRPTRHAGP